MSSLEPIEEGCEADDAHEADGGFLIAGSDSAPLPEPDPEPLDLISVVVDPMRASDGRLVALRRDRRRCAMSQMCSRKALLV